MRTSTQIKAELEKTNSRINQLRDLSNRQTVETASLEAARLRLESELKAAPEGEPASNQYINSRYKRPDKQ